MAFRVLPVSGHDVAPLSLHLESEATGLAIHAINVPNRPLSIFGPYTVGIVDASREARASPPAEEAKEVR